MIDVKFDYSLQKEVECLRLASQNQETECRRLTESLTISKQETKQLQDELQQKDNFIRIKVKSIHPPLEILFSVFFFFHSLVDLIGLAVNHLYH